MVMFLGNFLIAILVVLLWTGFVAPAILRTLGVPMAYGSWLDRRNQHLSKRQHVWGFGVLTYGVGMTLFSTSWSYLFSKPIPYRLSQMSATRIVVGLLSWLIIGWLVGVLSAPKNNTSGLPVR
jgi:FtsH-binding integral membrane protein